MSTSISVTAWSKVSWTSAPFMMSAAAFSKTDEMTEYAGVTGRSWAIASAKS